MKMGAHSPPSKLLRHTLLTHASFEIANAKKEGKGKCNETICQAKTFINCLPKINIICHLLLKPYFVA